MDKDFDRFFNHVLSAQKQNRRAGLVLTILVLLTLVVVVWLWFDDQKTERLEEACSSGRVSACEALKGD